jgi:predicted TPR repeat methyltransferase
MIRTDGFEHYNSWGHSASLRELYRRRCQRREPEMTCAAQAADLLAPLAVNGQTILDVGCGSGYFFHSLKNRNIPLEYYGVDATASLIKIGQEELPSYGLPADRLQSAQIEDLTGTVDFVLCMNVLTYLGNFHAALARILDIAETNIILRESFSDIEDYAFVLDDQLDEGMELNVHINTYNRRSVRNFIQARGFDVIEIQDIHSGGQPEFFLSRAHHWRFLVATRKPKPTS